MSGFTYGNIGDALESKQDTIIADQANIIADTRKIDDFATDGLAGVEDSLAYRANEIEKHLHNMEKWCGAAAIPSGETHVCDRASGSVLAFQLVSGASDFGSWVQLIGSGDSPITVGRAKFDLHRFLITTTNSTAPYIIQIVSGESAGIAAKISAEDFTEFVYVAATNSNDSGISDAMDGRVAAGTKMWARAACVGQTGKVIDMYFGLHEYVG